MQSLLGLDWPSWKQASLGSSLTSLGSAFPSCCWIPSCHPIRPYHPSSSPSVAAASAAAAGRIAAAVVAVVGTLPSSGAVASIDSW